MEAKPDKEDAEEGCSENGNAGLSSANPVVENQCKDVFPDVDVPELDSLPSAAENKAFVDKVMKQSLLVECGQEVVNSYLGQSTSGDMLARCPQQLRDDASSATPPMPKRRVQALKKGKHCNQELSAKTQATREIVQSAEPCGPEKSSDDNVVDTKKSNNVTPTSTAQTIITIQKEGSGPASKTSTSLLKRLLSKKKMKVASWQTQYVLEPQSSQSERPHSGRVKAKTPPVATLSNSTARSQNPNKRTGHSLYSERKIQPHLIRPNVVPSEAAPKSSSFMMMNPVRQLPSAPMSRLPLNTVVSHSTLQFGQRASISYNQTCMTSPFNTCSVSPSRFGSPLLCTVPSSPATLNSQPNSYLLLQPAQPVILCQDVDSLHHGAVQLNRPRPLVPGTPQVVNCATPIQLENNQDPGTSKEIQQTYYEQISRSQKIVVSTQELKQSADQGRLMSPSTSLQMKCSQAPFTASFKDFVKVRVQGQQIGAQWVLLPRGCVPQGIPSPPLSRKAPQASGTGRQSVDVQHRVHTTNTDVEESIDRFHVPVQHERIINMNSAYNMSLRGGLNDNQNDARVFTPVHQRRPEPSRPSSAAAARADSPGGRPVDIRVDTTTLSTPSLTYVSNSSKCKTLDTASQVNTSGVCEEQGMLSSGSNSPHQGQRTESTTEHFMPSSNSLNDYFGPVDMYVYLPEEAFKKGAITYMSLDN